MNLLRYAGSLLSVAFALSFAGCAEKPIESNAPANVPSASLSVQPSELSKKVAAKPTLNDEEKAEIAKLTEKKDQDAATAQVICPVSDENLGSMGVPIKVSADGKDAYLCCKGCVKDFEKDPKAVFAKLGK